MKDHRHACRLTDDEILLLDGKAGSEVQAVVDRVKKARSIAAEGVGPAEARFIADVLAEAESSGRLVFFHRYIWACPHSGRTAEYARRSRRSKYHRRGDIDYSRPIKFLGVELAHRAVAVEGFVVLGCSMEFWERVKLDLAARLKGVKAEIPEAITGRPPEWKWHQRRKCSRCGWQGHEGEMGLLRTLIGDGYYPGKCLECGAENTFLSSPVGVDEGFELVRVETRADKE